MLRLFEAPGFPRDLLDMVGPALLPHFPRSGPGSRRGAAKRGILLSSVNLLPLAPGEGIWPKKTRGVAEMS